MKRHKIVLTIETDTDPQTLTDEQVEELHLAMFVQGEDMYDVLTSKLEFDGVEVASL